TSSRSCASSASRSVGIAFASSLPGFAVGAVAMSVNSCWWWVEPFNAPGRNGFRPGRGGSGSRSGGVRSHHLRGDGVGAVIALAGDLQHLLKAAAGAADAALDRADGAIADLRRLLVGEAGGADQDDRLALVLRQRLQRGAEVAQIHGAVLAGMDGDAAGDGAVAVLDLAAALAHLRIELVAQDGEHPCLEIGARLERRLLVPRLHQRLLHQIVGPVGVLRQRYGEGAQAGDGVEQVLPEGRTIVHLNSPHAETHSRSATPADAGTGVPSRSSSCRSRSWN